jgi:hypothetical protein
MRLHNIEAWECPTCGHSFDLHYREGCTGLHWAPSPTDGRMEHGDCYCTRTRDDLNGGKAA